MINNQNKLIYDFLTEYAKNPDPQYAVMLKGKWGCGKTHFIKKWLEEYKEDLKGEEEETIDLKPIYVTLYGLTAIAEIKTAIDKEVNPFFYSKTGKVIKGVGKLVGKIVFKTSFDFTGDDKDDASFSGSLDSLSLFKKSNEDVVKGVRFIVFDDLERCQIEMKPLLGFLNYFVEHCDCHVVVLGDESKLDEKKKEELNEFKEKTVGREFEIEPDVEDAVDAFLSEPYISDYLKSERDYIIKCFLATGSDNLRLLRQSLMDFTSQIREVETEQNNVFLHGLLGSFIAVYAETNNKETQGFFEDYAKFYQEATYNWDGKKGEALKILNQKYNEISVGAVYHVLCVDWVVRIVKHIKTGAPLIDFIKKNINLKPREPKEWEKLSQFWEMSNDDFQVLYGKVRAALLDGHIELPYQMGTTIGYLAYMDAVGVKSFSDDDIKTVNDVIKNRFESCTSFDELFQIRTSLYQGINYVRTGDDDFPKLKDIFLCINESFEKKKNELPDKMQEVLRNLSDNNVNQLSVVDDETYPDHSVSYSMRAVFEQENVEVIFEHICALSNKGKNVFSSFISKHYLLNAQVDAMIAERYKPDLPVLQSLLSKINEKRKQSEGVDKLAYDRISDALSKAVKRSGGETKALL